MRIKSLDSYGLTLVEALITLAIGTVVGTLLLIIMVNTGGLFYQQSGKLEQGLNTNDALASLGQSIRESYQVAQSYPEAPPPTYTSGTSQIVLKIPSIDSSSDIIPNTFDYFVFFLDTSAGSGQVLRFKSFPASLSARKAQDQIFSTRVESLIFKYYDLQNQEVTPEISKKVRITLVLKQKAGAGIEMNVATTEANLRND